VSVLSFFKSDLKDDESLAPEFVYTLLDTRIVYLFLPPTLRELLLTLSNSIPFKSLKPITGKRAYTRRQAERE
jgi:hypothetical protein